MDGLVIDFFIPMPRLGRVVWPRYAVIGGSGSAAAGARYVVRRDVGSSRRLHMKQFIGQFLPFAVDVDAASGVAKIIMRCASRRGILQELRRIEGQIGRCHGGQRHGTCARIINGIGIYDVFTDGDGGGLVAFVLKTVCIGLIAAWNERVVVPLRQTFDGNLLEVRGMDGCDDEQAGQ